MEQFIGCDAHKRFSVFALNRQSDHGPIEKVYHDRESMRRFLATLAPGSRIGIEASGISYWVADEAEQAGHEPWMGESKKCKRLMEGRNKSDTKDAKAIAGLMAGGLFPKVWIPPRQIRDQRELLRLRMYLVQIRMGLKNRLHGTLLRYNVVVENVFSVGGRQQLRGRMGELPEHTQHSVKEQLKTLDALVEQIEELEAYGERMLASDAERDLLKTMPGVGPILSAVIRLEIGKVERFSVPERLASYAGVVPVTRESAGKRRTKQCPKDCNQYLKWALVEAANCVLPQQERWRSRHVIQLYQRVKRKTKQHGKAVMAVARHLAEAAYWILKKQEVYQEPKRRQRSIADAATAEGSFVDARVNAACP